MCLGSGDHKTSHAQLVGSPILRTPGQLCFTGHKKALHEEGLSVENASFETAGLLPKGD